MERLDKFVSHREGPLRAGPDCELVAIPLRYRRARLKRSMLDVCDGVGRFDLLVGSGQALGDGALLVRVAALASIR